MAYSERSSPLTLLSLAPNLFFSEQEWRCFEVFRTRSATELSSFFDSDFWCSVVLQISYTEPTIRHSMIALGSLYETCFHSEGTLVSGKAEHSRQYALEQCNKAISLLKQHLSTKGFTSTEVTLLSCLLLTLFETFQGNYESMLAHLASGLKILRSCSPKAFTPSSANAVTHASSFSIEECLVQFFTRLNNQATSFLDTRSLRLHLLSRNITTGTCPSIPSFFAGLDDARLSLGEIKWMFHVLEIKSQPQTQISLPTGDVLNKSNPEAQLEQWASTFDRFLRKRTPELSDSEMREVSLLRSHQLAASIMVSTATSTQETVYDSYTSQFENILHLSRYLSKGPIKSGAPQDTTLFSFDLGIIPPLYLTASRCREPSLRRQAIFLLRSPAWKEGVWDAILAARIAERLMAIEEEGLFPVASASDIPESSRVCSINLSFVGKKRQALLQYAKQGKRHLGLKEEWISW